MYSELIGNNKNIRIKSLIDNILNSGEWTDFKVTTTENQRKCILPMNDISTTIFYNKRIIISAPLETPVAWHCSKVEQTAPKGTNRLTFAQEEWDEHKDAFEYADGEFSSTYNPKKQVVGIYADYFSSSITPTDSEPLPTTDYAVITYAGTKPEIKSGGSYKKFTVTFFDADEQELPYRNGTWSYEIDGEDAISLLSIRDNTTSTDVEENQIKVKFNRDDTYIGKVLNIKFTSDDGIVTEIPIEIIGL